MAFSFDSSLGLCAALLCAVAILAWRLSAGRGASVRLNLRFAAILFAALGVSGLLAALTPAFAEVAFAIALLVISLAGAALMLSLFGPRPAPPLAAGVALVAGLMAGLVSALMDAPVFALISQGVSASAMILFGLMLFRDARLRAVEIIAGALALFCGGMALLQGALAAALFLFATGLLGLACASQARVQQKLGDGLHNAIGRPRV